MPLAAREAHSSRVLAPQRRLASIGAVLRGWSPLIFLRGDAPELARPLSRRPPLPSRDIDNPA